MKQSMEDGRPARPAKTLKLGAGRARLDRLRKNPRFVSGYAFRHTVSLNNGSGFSRWSSMFLAQTAFFRNLFSRAAGSDNGFGFSR